MRLQRPIIDPFLIVIHSSIYPSHMPSLLHLSIQDLYVLILALLLQTFETHDSLVFRESTDLRLL